jgi:hypothetical protein
MNRGFEFGREALANTPLHLTAPGPARARPSRGCIVTARAAGERQPLTVWWRLSRNEDYAQTNG